MANGNHQVSRTGIGTYGRSGTDADKLERSVRPWNVQIHASQQSGIAYLCICREISGHHPRQLLRSRFDKTVDRLPSSCWRGRAQWRASSGHAYWCLLQQTRCRRQTAPGKSGLSRPRSDFSSVSCSQACEQKVESEPGSCEARGGGFFGEAKFAWARDQPGRRV